MVLLGFSILVGYFLAKSLFMMRIWAGFMMDEEFRAAHAMGVYQASHLHQKFAPQIEEALTMFGHPIRWLYDAPYLPLALNVFVLGVATLKLRFIPFLLLWASLLFAETLATLASIVLPYWISQ
jgi:hypothetical protein